MKKSVSIGIKIEVEEVKPVLIDISPLKPASSASLAKAGAAARLSANNVYLIFVSEACPSEW